MHSTLKSVMKHSTKQNKPVKGIKSRCIRRQNATANRFEVGLDQFIKYIICLPKQNLFQKATEPS